MWGCGKIETNSVEEEEEEEGDDFNWTKNKTNIVPVDNLICFLEVCKISRVYLVNFLMLFMDSQNLVLGFIIDFHFNNNNNNNDAMLAFLLLYLDFSLCFQFQTEQKKIKADLF